MRKGIAAAGMIIIAIGLYLAWTTYEARQAIYAQMSKWEWTFLPAETKLRTYARLHDLNAQLNIAGALSLAGGIVAIVGFFQGPSQKPDLGSITGETSSIVRVRCLKCNELNHETSIFCVHCGTRLKSEPA